MLWWVNHQLARRFRRRINIGVAAAALTVAVLTVVAFAVAAVQSSHNSDLRDGSYAASYQESTARTAGNDAKANESLRLISRGSGQVYEDRWVVASQVVQDNASDETSALWDDYVAVHQQVVDLDDGGKWEKAVRLSTTTDSSGSTAALDAFDTRAQEIVSDSGAATTDALAAATPASSSSGSRPCCSGSPRRHGGLGHRAAAQGVRMNTPGGILRRALVAVAATAVLAGCGYSATPILEAVPVSPATAAPAPPCDATGATRSHALPGGSRLPATCRTARRWRRSATVAT